jgi:tetratricopeptide (TPR) repeat protein
VLPVEELQESIQANDIEVPAESVEEPPAPVEDLEFESTSEVDKVAAALNWSEELPQAGTDEPEIAEKAEELLPDWLKGLVGEEPAEAAVDQQEPAQVEENVEDSEVPEWLQSLQKQVEQNQDIPDFQGQLPVSPAIPLETAASHGAETAISSQGGDFQTILQAARNDLERGKIDPAVEKFSGLIQSGQFLEESIHDLRDALYRYPVDISLWQTLGDAYAHSNMLQEALDAYTKAEELLR